MSKALQSILLGKHLNCVLRRGPRNNSGYSTAALFWNTPKLVWLDIRRPNCTVPRQWMHKLGHRRRHIDLQQPCNFIAWAYYYSGKYKHCCLHVRLSRWCFLISDWTHRIDNNLSQLLRHISDTICSVHKHRRSLLDDAPLDNSSANGQCWLVKRKHSLRT